MVILGNLMSELGSCLIRELQSPIWMFCDGFDKRKRENKKISRLLPNYPLHGRAKTWKQTKFSKEFSLQLLQIP